MSRRWISDSSSKSVSGIISFIGIMVLGSMSDSRSKDSVQAKKNTFVSNIEMNLCYMSQRPKHTASRSTSEKMIPSSTHSAPLSGKKHSKKPIKMLKRLLASCSHSIQSVRQLPVLLLRHFLRRRHSFVRPSYIAIPTTSEKRSMRSSVICLSPLQWIISYQGMSGLAKPRSQ